MIIFSVVTSNRWVGCQSARTPGAGGGVVRWAAHVGGMGKVRALGDSGCGGTRSRHSHNRSPASTEKGKKLKRTFFFEKQEKTKNFMGLGKDVLSWKGLIEAPAG